MLLSSIMLLLLVHPSSTSLANFVWSIQGCSQSCSGWSLKTGTSASGRMSVGTFRTTRTDTKRMLIRHLGPRIRQRPCGELVFTNGSLFIRGALRIRQVHIYLVRYTCFARYTFFPWFHDPCTCACKNPYAKLPAVFVVAMHICMTTCETWNLFSTKRLRAESNFRFAFDS